MQVRTRSYEDLVKLIEESGRSYNFPLIEKAYKIAEKAHDGQLRSSGEP